MLNDFDFIIRISLAVMAWTLFITLTGFLAYAYFKGSKNDNKKH